MATHYEIQYPTNMFLPSTQVNLQGLWRWTEARWMEAACSERPISATAWCEFIITQSYIHPNPRPYSQFRSVWNMWLPAPMTRSISRTQTCAKQCDQIRTPSYSFWVYCDVQQKRKVLNKSPTRIIIHWISRKLWRIQRCNECSACSIAKPVWRKSWGHWATRLLIARSYFPNFHDNNNNPLFEIALAISIVNVKCFIWRNLLKGW